MSHYSDLENRFDGPIPEHLKKWALEEDAKAIVLGSVAAQRDHWIAEYNRVEQEKAELRAALSDFLRNPLFQVSVGGNPIAVNAMIERAHTLLARTK